MADAPTTEEVRAMLTECGFDAIGRTQSYGVALSDDPRDFTPDPEASTDEERAQHAADVAAWERGERPERNHRCDLTQPVGAMSANATPWGLGTTTTPDPVAVAALALAEHRDALAAEVARLRADIEHFQRAASESEQVRRDLVTERDALRPLAELGALALAWGRALRECAAARDAVKHATDLPAMLSAQHRAIDDAWDARAKLATAAMRMVEEEQQR